MTCAPPAPEAVAPVIWRDVTVRYPFRGADAVGPVTLAVRPGERVLLLGPTGSGKSTLLNALTGIVPGIVPAELGGEVLLMGEAASSRPPSGWSGEAARLFQDADQTLCGMRVGDEIAFALENRALPEPEILRRIDAAMHRTGLASKMRQRRTATLSGGEKQLVALAAALAQETPLFIADEPTAHLAPVAAARFCAVLEAETSSRAFIVVDHRIDELAGCFDRVVVIGANGGIVADGPPRTIFRERYADLCALGVAMPVAADLDASLRDAGVAPSVPPLTVSEALEMLDPAPAALNAVRAFLEGRVARPVERPGETVARLENAACAPLFGPVVLRGVDLVVRAGEAVAILGPNGAGKTTLAASLAGLLRLKSGRRHGAPGGVAFQNPEHQFVGGSVIEEIHQSLNGKQSRTKAENAAGDAAQQILARWGLSALSSAHPYELSQGQKRRLALAALTATDRWPLLVLDEPTAGLDAAGARMVAEAVEGFRATGRAVAVVTHDLDFALRTCPRVVIVADGGIIADGPTAELLADAALLARAGLAAPPVMQALSWLERHAPC
jgi:energy-coupling factor transport system ATP-binding protein